MRYLILVQLSQAKTTRVIVQFLTRVPSRSAGNHLSELNSELPVQALSNADFNFLMSSFFIFHISTIMASFFALFLVVFHLSKSAGVICQRTPNLSINQPHSTGLPPPAVSLF